MIKFHKFIGPKIRGKCVVAYTDGIDFMVTAEDDAGNALRHRIVGKNGISYMKSVGIIRMNGSEFDSFVEEMTEGIEFPEIDTLVVKRALLKLGYKVKRI